MDAPHGRVTRQARGHKLFVNFDRYREDDRHHRCGPRSVPERQGFEPKPEALRIAEKTDQTIVRVIQRSINHDSAYRLSWGFGAYFRCGSR